MDKIEYVWFSSIKMVRVWCSICEGKTLVIDGKKQCCNVPIIKDTKRGILKRELTGVFRKSPNAQQKKFMLEAQNNKCFYCEICFGEPFLHPRTKKLCFTSVCYDHFVPYSYSQDNRQINFVGACQICNSIKTNLVFNTREEAIDYVKYRRKKKGYEKAFSQKELPEL